MEPVTSTFIGEGALQDFEGSPGCMGLVTVVKRCRLTGGGDWVYPGGELYAETMPKGRREDEDVLLPHVENLAGKWGVVLVIAALKALGWEIKGGGGDQGWLDESVKAARRVFSPGECDRLTSARNRARKKKLTWFDILGAALHDAAAKQVGSGSVSCTVPTGAPGPSASATAPGASQLPPSVGVSAPMQGIVQTKRSDIRAICSTTYASEHPLNRSGLLSGAVDLVEMEDIHAQLGEGSDVRKQARLWCKGLCDALGPAAADADAGYSIKLNGDVVGKAYAVQKANTTAHYVNTASTVVAFLMWEGALVLPAFETTSSDQGVLVYEGIMGAMLKLTAGEYEGRRMTVFLRWMTTTWVLKERTLCPRSMSTIGAHVSALMYVFKVLWKAAYVGMRDRREKKLAGVTVEEAGVIYGGSMASTISMTTVFWLKKYCAASREADAAFYVIPVLDPPGGGIACDVGSVRMATTDVAAIVWHLRGEAAGLVGDLGLGDLHPSVLPLLEGDIYVDVEDADTCALASYEYLFNQDDSAPAPVTSAVLTSKLVAKLGGMGTLPFKAWLGGYLCLLGKVQAVVSLLHPKRETELLNIMFTNTDGGGKRKIRYFNSRRTADGGFPVTIFVRRKEKFSRHEERMVSVVDPWCALHLLVLNSLREAVAAAMEARSMPVPTGFRTHVFPSMDGGVQADTGGATNLKDAVAAAVTVINGAKAEGVPDMVGFSTRSLRHLHNLVLKVVVDEIERCLGVDGAGRTRAAIAESDTMGHSEESGNYYLDNGLYHTQSVKVDSATMGDIIGIQQEMLRRVGFSFTVSGKLGKTTLVRKEQHKSVGSLFKWAAEDSDDDKVGKVTAYLQQHDTVLRMALGSDAGGPVVWDAEVLRAIAMTIVWDYGGGGVVEGRARRHLALCLPMGAGKTLVVVVIALLLKLFVPNEKARLTVVLYPSISLLADAKQRMQAVGLQVISKEDGIDAMSRDVRAGVQGPAIFVCCYETFAHLAVKDLSSLCRQGHVGRVYLDEAQEVCAQWRFRGSICTVGTELRGGGFDKCSMTLMSGTFCPGVQGEATNLLGITSTDLVTIAKPVSVPRNPNIKFTAVDSETEAKALALVAEQCVSAARQQTAHLVLVMTIPLGRKLEELLGGEGVGCFFVNSEVRAQPGGEALVDSETRKWKLGTASFVVLIATGNMCGLNHPELPAVDIVGSYGLMSAFQSALRPARRAGQLGEARFVRWPGWEQGAGVDPAKESSIPVLQASSFNGLFEPECLRYTLNAATESAEAAGRRCGDTAGCEECSHCRPPAVGMAPAGAAAAALVGGSSGGWVGEKRVRSPERAAPAAPKVLTALRALTLIRGAVLGQAQRLHNGKYCPFCGDRCGIYEGKHCPAMGRLAKGRCETCLEEGHSARVCKLQLKEQATKVCTCCHLLNCSSFFAANAESGVFQDVSFECPNPAPALGKNGIAFTAAFVCSRVLFDEAERARFVEFLAGSGLPASSEWVAFLKDSRATVRAKWDWLYEPVDEQMGTVKRYNLAYLYHWVQKGWMEMPSFRVDGGGGGAGGGAGAAPPLPVPRGGGGGGGRPQYTQHVNNPYAPPVRRPDYGVGGASATGGSGGGGKRARVSFAGASSPVPGTPAAPAAAALDALCRTPAAQRVVGPSNHVMPGAPPRYLTEVGGNYLCSCGAPAQAATNWVCEGCRQLKPVVQHDGKSVNSWVCRCNWWNYASKQSCSRYGCDEAKPVWDESHGFNLAGRGRVLKL